MPKPAPGKKSSAAKTAVPGKKNGREEEFLIAALHLFAERNFASVTIKDIAQSLGVNTALIYYYFEDKTDLLRATIELAVARALPACTTTRPTSSNARSRKGKQPQKSTTLIVDESPERCRYKP